MGARLAANNSQRETLELLLALQASKDVNFERHDLDYSGEMEKITHDAVIVAHMCEISFTFTEPTMVKAADSGVVGLISYCDVCNGLQREKLRFC